MSCFLSITADSANSIIIAVTTTELYFPIIIITVGVHLVLSTSTKISHQNHYVGTQQVTNTHTYIHGKYDKSLNEDNGSTMIVCIKLKGRVGEVCHEKPMNTNT